MVTTYTTAEKVGDDLGKTFTTSSSPTILQVESWINRYEDYIDDKSGHAWRSVSITDEYVNPTSAHIYGTGVPFKLLHRKIQSIEKFEIFDGSAWIDLVATGTEGRTNDYWVDETNGVIYSRSRRRFFKSGVRVSYTFGDVSVSGTVEDLCTILAQIKVLRRQDKVVTFADDGGSSVSIPRDRKIDSLKDEAKDLFDELYEFVHFI
jgi:hypothetical protein